MVLVPILATHQKNLNRSAWARRRGRWWRGRDAAARPPPAPETRKHTLAPTFDKPANAHASLSTLKRKHANICHIYWKPTFYSQTRKHTNSMLAQRTGLGPVVAKIYS